MFDIEAPAAPLGANKAANATTEVRIILVTDEALELVPLEDTFFDNGLG